MWCDCLPQLGAPTQDFSLLCTRRSGLAYWNRALCHTVGAPQHVSAHSHQESRAG
jgi:hypothetical protein